MNFTDSSDKTAEKVWLRITMTLLQRDLSQQGRVRNLPAFFKGIWVGNGHGKAPWCFHWLNSQKSWTKDTFSFRWLTWTKYNSMMSPFLTAFTWILFSHLEISKWEIVRQFIRTSLSIQTVGTGKAWSLSSSLGQWPYSWVWYIVTFFPYGRLAFIPLIVKCIELLNLEAVSNRTKKKTASLFSDDSPHLSLRISGDR